MSVHSRSQFDYQRCIVGLNFRFVCCLVSDYCTTFIALVDYHISLFWIRFSLDRTENTTAVVGSVTGIYINVQGAEAERAVVAGGIAKAFYLFSAAGADKSAVIFGESFDFRSDHSFHRTQYPILNIFIIFYHTFCPFSRPCHLF